MSRLAPLQLRSTLNSVAARRVPSSCAYSTKKRKHGQGDTRASTEPSSANTAASSQEQYGYGFDYWAEVNPADKTIATAAGPLPLSPLLDPKWRDARQKNRHRTKRAPDVSKQCRFQRNTRLNPYAQLLAEPVRSCHITRTRLPKPFLQDFGLASNPETGDLWWIPGDFQSSRQHAPPAEAEAKVPEPDQEGSRSTNATGQASSTESPNDTAVTSEDATANAATDTATAQDSSPAKRSGKFFAPAHMLARQDLMLEFLDKKSRHSSGYMRFAALPTISSHVKRANWRRDMHEVVRAQARTQIAHELTRLVAARPNMGFVIPLLGGFKKPFTLGSCFLSFEEREDRRPRPFDVLEMESVVEGPRPVFDVPRLLGPELVERLRSDAPLYSDGSLFLLRGRGTGMTLQKLWKLQAFLAEWVESDQSQRE